MCFNSFDGTLCIVPLIFNNALAKLAGFRVIWAAPLSAEYSLYREMALIIRKLTIQVTNETTIMITIELPLFRSLPAPYIPPKNPNCIICHAMVENKLASVITITSRFFMCVNSCAKTPSNSS